MRTSEFETPDIYEADVGTIHIASWCPAPKPTVPPTQVHFFMPIAGMKILYRFKGSGTLDKLIDALIEHREDVWGKRK